MKNLNLEQRRGRSPNPDPNAPWKNYNLPPCYLLSIVLRTTDPEDGSIIEQHTWTAGRSQGAAIRKWKTANPVLAASLHSYTLVTPVKGARVLYPELLKKGPRVKVRDEALLKCAVGL